MDWSGVGELVDEHQEIVRSVLSLAYILAILLVGAVLVGDPTSNYPIISDAVGLVLVVHAYRTGNLAALGSTLLLVAALGIWFLIASPSLPGVDIGALVPASVPSEAVPPIGLAAVLAVGYALTVAEVLPQLDRVVAERVQ